MTIADVRTRPWANRLAAAGVTTIVIAGLMSAVSAPPAYALGSPTITTVSSSQNPSAACGNVTFTATVYGALFPDSPLGGVQFFDGASTLGSLQVITPDFDTFLGAHVVPTNHSSATVTASLSGGSHSITVQYAGTDVPSHGGPYLQNVGAAPSTTVVTSSTNPSVFGQPVTFRADVASPCVGSVAGSVQLTADGTNLGEPQPLNASGGATVLTAALQAGTHLVEAAFSSSNTSVTGSAGTLPGGQVVQPAGTATTLTSTTNPSEYGASVGFTATTATVSPGAGTATGATQFQDNAVDLDGPTALSGGQASTTTAGLSVGTHSISAAYTTNSPNFTSSSALLSQGVNKARTTLSYDGVTSSDFNDSAVLSAHLSRTHDAAVIPGANVALRMGAETCTALTDAGGEATCRITPSEPAGLLTATAYFAGDGNYLSSTTNSLFTVTREETTMTYTGPTVIAQGNPVTLSGLLREDGTTPISGRTLTLTLGVGATAQACTSTPTDAAGNAHCTVTNVTVGQGPQPVTADFAGDGFYLPSTDTSQRVIIFAFPTQGIFVLGDRSSATRPANVTFWGAEWSALNALTGGPAPASFKGFGSSPASRPPACGSTWTSSPGNSGNPVDSVPEYMGTAVTTTVAKQGSTVSGLITRIVVVRTDAGYASNPGHPGGGSIIATYC